MREPPIFDPRPQEKYHGELGKDVTLVCGGKGSPTPTVTWRRVRFYTLGSGWLFLGVGRLEDVFVIKMILTN